MELKYGRSYHPTFAWGSFTVLACLVIITIFAVTGIIPSAMQPPLMFSLLIAIIIGGAIGLAGFFKSFDRGAYPILVVILFIPVIFVIVWYFTR